MFKLKKRKAPVSVNVVDQIHNDFDSAEDRLLQEAITIINRQSASESKAKRAARLGFSRSKPAARFAEEYMSKEASRLLQANIEYFRKKYPFNKFITEDEVIRLCKKWGLVLGDAHAFAGDIPEKNLQEIESFKLDRVDYAVRDFSRRPFAGRLRGLWLAELESAMFSPVEISVDFDRARLDAGASEIAPEPEVRIRGRMSGIDKWADEFYRRDGLESDGYVNPGSKPDFKIVAPLKDFDQTNKRLIDEYRLEDNPPAFDVYDPIVLQPVKGGYLIVSKWGPEASDEIVTNEIFN